MQTQTPIQTQPLSYVDPRVYCEADTSKMYEVSDAVGDVILLSELKDELELLKFKHQVFSFRMDNPDITFEEGRHIHHNQRVSATDLEAMFVINSKMCIKLSAQTFKYMQVIEARITVLKLKHTKRL
jgi:hypothetical protein